MLQKEAEELGHETSLIDAKTTQINTDSQIQDFNFGNIVLERCVSYYRGLYFTACLEFLDVPVINKFNVSTICGNKLLTSMLLKKNNIPTPKTHFSFSADASTYCRRARTRNAKCRCSEADDESRMVRPPPPQPSQPRLLPFSRRLSGGTEDLN